MAETLITSVTATAAFQIAGFSFKLYSAKEEIDIDKRILDDMFNLASSVDSACDRISAFLAEDRRRIIKDTVQNMYALLEELEVKKAGTFGMEGKNDRSENDGKFVGGLRRVIWVFKDKGTAETYRNLLGMRYQRLLNMENELALIETKSASHGRSNSMTVDVSSVERKHTTTATATVVPDPSSRMHELDSKENDFYTEHSSSAPVSSVSLPGCLPSQGACESTLPDISSMQSFEFSPRTSCSSLATYPSYAECDTPITDDDMSSYSHKFPDYLYETISNPLPTYTTSPRGKGDLDPSLLFERINSPSTRPYAIYAKSSYNNEDEVLGSNPPQAPNALPSYTTSRGNYPPHKRTNSVPLRTASPLDRRDHDSNPPQAPTSPTSTYPPLPWRKGYLDRFDPSSSSGRINSPSSGPCTGPSPKNEDRNSGPPPEPTSLLPSYTTSFQRNFPCPPYERARSAPITTASPLERKDKNSNSPLEPTNRLPNYTTSRGNRDIRPRPLHAETLPAYAMSSPNDGDQNLHPPQVSTSPPSHNTTSWTLWNRTRANPH